MNRNTLMSGVPTLGHLLGLSRSAQTAAAERVEPKVEVEVKPGTAAAAKPKAPKEPVTVDLDDEDDDDDEDEDATARGTASPKAIRTAERARCAAIVGGDEGLANPEMAAHLAFQTGMSADKAKALLATAPKSGSLATRMAAVPNAPVGAGVDTPSLSPREQNAKVQSSWDKAFGLKK